MSNSRHIRRKLAGKSGSSFRKSQRRQRQARQAFLRAQEATNLATTQALSLLGAASEMALENLSPGETGDDVVIEVGGTDDSGFEATPGEGS